MDVVGQGEVPRRGLKMAGLLSLPLVVAVCFSFTYPHQSKAQEGRQIPLSCAKTGEDWGTLNAGGLDCSGKQRVLCAI